MSSDSNNLPRISETTIDTTEETRETQPLEENNSRNTNTASTTDIEDVNIDETLPMAHPVSSNPTYAFIVSELINCNVLEIQKEEMMKVYLSS